MKSDQLFCGTIQLFLVLLVLCISRAMSYHDVVIGGECRYDEDCFTDHSFCYMHEVCACKDGFIVTDDLQRCIATVGGVCRSRHDCSDTLDNSFCLETKCACLKGYVPGALQLNCLQVALAVGDICEEDIQCQDTMGDLSRCLNGRCFCQPGHHFINRQCLKSKKLYEPCSTWHDCFIGKEFNNSVDCVDGTCKCKHGFYHTPDNKCNNLNGTIKQVTVSLSFLLLAVFFPILL